MAEIREELKHKLEEELKPYMNDAMLLQEAEIDDLNKVNESTFKTYILPYMLNLVERNEENDKRFFYNFAELAGDIVREFIVVDDNTDELLFKVPALIADYNTEGNPLDMVSYTSIVNNYTLVSENNPLLAERELSQVLDTLGSMFDIDRKSIDRAVHFYLMLKERYADFIEEYENARKEYEEGSEGDDVDESHDEYDELDYED